MTTLKTHWPVIAAIAFLWILLAMALQQIYQMTGGHLVYALDDPYIHMAVARNFADYGVWGVTRYHFSSSTSSMLWPLLLALDYAIFGANEISVFLLNALFATLTLVVAYRFLLEYLPHPAGLTTVLLALVLFVPLPMIVFIGMEHSLQAFVVLVFVITAAREIAQPRPRGLAFAAACAFIACLTRYESLFAIVAVVLLLFIRRRWRDAILVGVSGGAPAAAYAIISLAQGWYAVPNSLLLRGPDVDAVTWVLQVIRTLLTSPYLSIPLLLVIVLLLLRLKQGQVWTVAGLAMVIFAVNASIHFGIARVGWFYRYEAYLVALGIVVLTAGFLEQPIRVRLGTGYVTAAGVSLLALIGFVGLISLVSRGWYGFSEIRPAVANIYNQQYQIGLFVREYYEGQRVVANDIGAINYFADIDNLDIYGLGSLEVLAAKRAGRYDQASLEALTSDAKIAIVYTHWLPGEEAPPDWRLVGQWIIPDNIVTGGDTVSFYAINPDARAGLVEHLVAFSSQLPSDVVQDVNEQLVTQPQFWIRAARKPQAKYATP